MRLQVGREICAFNQVNYSQKPSFQFRHSIEHGFTIANGNHLCFVIWSTARYAEAAIIRLEIVEAVQELEPTNNYNPCLEYVPQCTPRGEY